MKKELLPSIAFGTDEKEAIIQEAKAKRGHYNESCRFEEIIIDVTAKYLEAKLRREAERPLHAAVH